MGIPKTPEMGRAILPWKHGRLPSGSLSRRYAWQRARWALIQVTGPRNATLNGSRAPEAHSGCLDDWQWGISGGSRLPWHDWVELYKPIYAKAVKPLQPAIPGFTCGPMPCCTDIP